MTEDDAKTKNCPLFGAAAMIALATIAVPDAAKHFEAGRKCEGSACMMWRWDVIKVPVEGLEPGKIYTESEFFRDATDATSGYCGLGGVQVNHPQPIVVRADMARPIGKGVYNNPQPGDADHGKVDVGSGG